MTVENETTETRPIIICGPSCETSTIRAYRTSWCFHCRKVTDHLYQIVSTVEPSYYEPVPQIVCARCGILDADLFPGTSREWEW